MLSINERTKLGSRKRVSSEVGLRYADEFAFSYEQYWPKLTK